MLKTSVYTHRLSSAWLEPFRAGIIRQPKRWRNVRPKNRYANRWNACQRSASIHLFTALNEVMVKGISRMSRTNAMPRDTSMFGQKEKIRLMALPQPVKVCQVADCWNGSTNHTQALTHAAGVICGSNILG
jgi:hypothetical protein